MKPWLSRGNELSVYNTLIQELCQEEKLEYKRFLRMIPEMFDEVEVDNASPATFKLAATICLLSTGSN